MYAYVFKYMRNAGCELILLAIIQGMLCQWATAKVTHLEVSFDNFALGPVEGQFKEPQEGIWLVASEGTADVISSPDRFCGERALSVYREVRGAVFSSLDRPLYVTASNKIYLSVDLYRPEEDSVILVALTSEGITSEQGPGLYVTQKGQLRVNVSSADRKTERQTIPDFLMKVGCWYRVDCELTATGEGSGRMDVYVSSQDSPRRELVLEGVDFAFAHTESTRLNIIPQSSSGLYLTNIAIYGELESFPESAFPQFPPVFQK